VSAWNRTPRLFTKHRISGPGCHPRSLTGSRPNKGCHRSALSTWTYALDRGGTTGASRITPSPPGDDGLLPESLLVRGRLRPRLPLFKGDPWEQRGAFGRINEQEVIEPQWGRLSPRWPPIPATAAIHLQGSRPATAPVQQTLSLGLSVARTSNWHVARPRHPAFAIRRAWWELHHPIRCRTTCSDLLEKEAEAHGMKLVRCAPRTGCGEGKIPTAPFGNELGRDATPMEADLPRFV